MFIMHGIPADLSPPLTLTPTGDGIPADDTPADTYHHQNQKSGVKKKETRDESTTEASHTLETESYFIFEP